MRPDVLAVWYELKGGRLPREVGRGVVMWLEQEPEDPGDQKSGETRKRRREEGQVSGGGGKKGKASDGDKEREDEEDEGKEGEENEYNEDGWERQPVPEEALPEGWHLPRIHSKLYLGNQQVANNVDWLRRAGITRIVRCNGGKPVLTWQEDCMRLETSEGEQFEVERISRNMNDGVVGGNVERWEDGMWKLYEGYGVGMTLESWLKDGKKVLVHCQHGQSRSQTIVALYAAVKKGIKPCDTLNYIREVKTRLRVPDAGKGPKNEFGELLQTLNGNEILFQFGYGQYEAKRADALPQWWRLKDIRKRVKARRRAWLVKHGREAEISEEEETDSLEEEEAEVVEVEVDEDGGVEESKGGDEGEV